MRKIWPLNVTAAVLMGAGIAIACAGHDTLRWSPPPLPPRWAAVSGQRVNEPPAALGRRYRSGPDSRRLPAPLPRSQPVRVDIPVIGVRARVIPLGLNPDGTVAVPPLTAPFLTGWYDRGPAPGEPGAAVLLGHVDARSVGPAVFYRLGDLRPGDRIFIELADGRTAVFQVSSVALYLKTAFPTDRVYGYTAWPTLRLVTCGGTFDQRTGHYLGNIVAFATYAGQRPAAAAPDGGRRADPAGAGTATRPGD
jgi:Sortase domain